MNQILLALVIGGGVLAFLGVQELQLSSAAKAEPQAISCATLSATGPGDNAHVLMSEFLLCDFAFVYKTAKRSEAWQTVWVPAVPIGGEFHKAAIEAIVRNDGKVPADMPVPKDVRVIVKSSSVANEAALSVLAEQDTLRGMIVNKIDKLGKEERKMLAESYPSANFDNVWVIEEGRTPATAGKSFGMLGGGSLLALLGVGGFVKTRKG